MADNISVGESRLWKIWCLSSTCGWRGSTHAEDRRTAEDNAVALHPKCTHKVLSNSGADFSVAPDGWEELDSSLPPIEA